MDSDVSYFSNTSNMNMNTFTELSRGQNGITYLVTYKDGRKALLKRPVLFESDNLMYEYIVGKEFINKHLETGIFVKTYAFLKLKDYYLRKRKCPDQNNDESINAFLEIPIKSSDLQLVDNVSNGPLTLEKLNQICKCNIHFFVLVEYLSDAISFQQYITQGKTNYPLLRENLIVIFQKIYTTLVQLYPNFVHNDLSVENVLVVNNEPRLIDYGRCYFQTSTTSSKKIYDLVRTICIKNGNENGFQDIWNINTRNDNKEDIFFMNEKCRRGMNVDEYFCENCRNGKDLSLLYSVNDDDFYNPHPQDDLKAFLRKINPYVFKNSMVVISQETGENKGRKKVLSNECDFDAIELDKLGKEKDVELSKDPLLVTSKEGPVAPPQITTIQEALMELDKLARISLLPPPFNPRSVALPVDGGRRRKSIKRRKTLTKKYNNRRRRKTAKKRIRRRSF